MSGGSPSKLRVLFRGWILQHSYAMVFTNQLLTFAKYFGDIVSLYLEECEYFNPKWNSTKKFVFSDEDQKIINSIPRYNGQEIDIIYSVTFPYDIQPVKRKNKESFIPKLVFYTSEFAKIDSTYFSLCYPNRIPSNDNTENTIAQVLHSPKFNIYMTSPSKWSSIGLHSYGVVGSLKNFVLSHGVSNDFYRNTKSRASIRKFYGFKDSDIVLLCVGSMTQNKGIVELLQAFYILNVEMKEFSNVKLLLKGSDSLYDSRKFIQMYIKNIIQSHNTNITFEKKFISMCNNIVYVDDTFSNKRMNDIFNSCDIYVSGYMAEGFNLVPLEALTAGMKLVISKTGSTSDYINNIINNTQSSNLIHLIDTKIVKCNNGMTNTYTIESLVNSIIQAINTRPTEQEISDVHSFIKNNYSWNNICEQLLNHFYDIIAK